uniref:Uncharacterized protein n=1 Tax=Megaselia scalaris TaxID=36166 RepID=T1GAB2_MEGSC
MDTLWKQYVLFGSSTIEDIRRGYCYLMVHNVSGCIPFLLRIRGILLSSMARCAWVGNPQSYTESVGLKKTDAHRNRNNHPHGFL